MKLENGLQEIFDKLDLNPEDKIKFQKEIEDLECENDRKVYNAKFNILIKYNHSPERFQEWIKTYFLEDSAWYTSIAKLKVSSEDMARMLDFAFIAKHPDYIKWMTHTLTEEEKAEGMKKLIEDLDKKQPEKKEKDNDNK